MKPTSIVLVLIFSLISHHTKFAAAAETDAADRIVVTANRIETDENQIASSFSVIDRKTIERSNRTSVSDLLRAVPGVAVSQSGPAGSPTSVFIRGANAEHTLVLIDGVIANDPLNTTRSFDFGNLSTNEVERIEVLRGAQSVLYGSDAMGGVINIITRHGSGPTKVTGEIGYGTYQTFKAAASLRGGDREKDYLLGAAYDRTAGFSAADEALGNSENDGRRLGTLSFKGGLRPVKSLRLEGSARYSDSRFNLDSTGGPGGDDLNYTGTEKTLQSRIVARLEHSSFWRPSLWIAYSQNRRTTDNAPDAKNPTPFSTQFDSHRIQTGMQNDFHLDDVNTITLGLEHQKESGASTALDQSATISSVFAQHQYLTDSFFTSEGARLDHHDRFGSRVTGRLAPGFEFESLNHLRLKGSLGTGFKAPSLYQLYSSDGNPALSPERSVSWDLGLEKKFLHDQSLSAGITWFDNHFTDLIDYDTARSRYFNTGRASSKGLEVTSSMRMTPALLFSAGWTYTLTRDEESGRRLLRRPLHSVTAELDYDVSDRLGVELGWRLTGARADVDAISFQRTSMPSYQLLDLAGTWQVQNDLDLLFRLNNLTDEIYEEVNGYGTSRRAVFLSMRKVF